VQFQDLLLDQHQATGIICLNRPEKLNALDGNIIREVVTALDLLDADPKVAVIVIKGNGRAFCSGKDLDDDYPDEASARCELEAAQAVTSKMLSVSKPIIAAIHGYALGGGLEWAMNCDIRVAATGAKLGFPETKWGFTVTNAASKLLPNLVGTGRAKELIFTGQFIDADQAAQWGLVNRVVPPEQLDEAVFQLAAQIAENSSTALTLAKRALDARGELSVEAVLSAEIEDAMLVLQNDDTRARLDGSGGSNDG
jgi:enoyl-CoA hydratase